MWDGYEWKNTFWGNHYFNATPKAGNRFLVLFVRLINPGTKPVLAPFAGLRSSSMKTGVRTGIHRQVTQPS